MGGSVLKGVTIPTANTHRHTTKVVSEPPSPERTIRPEENKTRDTEEGCAVDPQSLEHPHHQARQRKKPRCHFVQGSAKHERKNKSNAIHAGPMRATS